MFRMEERLALIVVTVRIRVALLAMARLAQRLRTAGVLSVVTVFVKNPPARTIR